jgi:FkbM family methyltransferase
MPAISSLARNLLRSCVPKRLYRMIRFFYRLPIYNQMDSSYWIQREASLGEDCVILDEKLVIRLPNDAVANRIFQKMAFESDEWRCFAKLAYGTSRLIDVGASGGFFSLIFIKTRPEAGNATVISIECDPGSLDILRFVKDRNSDGSAWEVVPEAVCGKKGRVQLVSSGYGAVKANTDEIRSAAKFYSEMNRKPYTEFAVEGDTLESIASKRSFIPDIIKMDIDGMEAEVIEGSTEWLRRHKPRLHLEVHPEHIRKLGKSPEKCLSILRSSGFKVADGGSWDNVLHQAAGKNVFTVQLV